MGETTKISWCDHTCNLHWGCVEVHRGCDNCYAKAMDRRYGGRHWGANSPRRYIKSAIPNLRKWQHKAEIDNVVRRVFVGSMQDIFERSRPLITNNGEPIEDVTTSHLRVELFYLIDSDRFPNLDFLLLTKRPHNIKRMIPPAWQAHGAPPNVLFGTSVVDPPSAKRDIDALIKYSPPGNLLFLSVEPQLAFIDLTPWLREPMVDWVIVGGESGAHARKFDIRWAERIVFDCQHHRVPVFMKQIGSNPYDDHLPFETEDNKGADPEEWPETLRVQEFYIQRRINKELRLDYGG